MKLTAKQIAFVDEYFSNKFNATEAYQKVYGCSYNAARSAAARLFNHFIGVQRYCELLRKEQRTEDRRRDLAKYSGNDLVNAQMRMLINDRYKRTDLLSRAEKEELEAIRVLGEECLHGPDKT